MTLKFKDVIFTDNASQNLNIIISFYQDVWSKYQTYYYNDIALYEIFRNKNNNFHDFCKISILNNFYSAGMNNIQIYEFVDNLSKLDLANVGITKYCGIKNDGSKYCSHLLSLESKFLHWSKELSGDKSVPIYDNNVINELKIAKKLYKINHNNDLFSGLDSHNKTEFSIFILKINLYITKYLRLDNPEDRIPLEIDNLHKKVSIYRLVDKFLWLNNKFRVLNQKIISKKPLNENDNKLDQLSNNYNVWYSKIIS